MTNLAVILTATLGFTFALIADSVSTAEGNGSDVEMRERSDGGSTNFTQNAFNNDELNTRTASGGDRNEIVGLRFDLSGYTLSYLSNVTVNLTAYRTDTSTRVVNLYGVSQGTAGGTATYTTENWSDTALDASNLFGDLPGLLGTDSDPATQSLNTSGLTFLEQINLPGGSVTEGSIVMFSDSAITTFIQNYTGSGQITFVLAAGNGSSGQWRTASKEATSTLTGVLTGSAGDFAPYLEFDLATTPLPSGLFITNIVVNAGDVVLSGGGGPSNGDYALLASEDIEQPVTNWTSLSTNSFDMIGDFIVTNPVAANAFDQFYRIQTLVLTPDGPDFSLIGFATVSGNTTGGAGGTTQTVNSAAAFIAAVGAGDARVVQVQGTLNLGGSSVSINSDKTIVGLGTTAGLIGELSISTESNVIIRNLTLTNPSDVGDGDGLRIINGSHHIWVDHCTFVDCSDGELDISQASDFITVSWCKFNYTFNSGHNFVNLIGSSDGSTGDRGKLNVTFHHNWWSTLCRERMPRVRFGDVHVFNNYFNAPGNNYCIRAALECEVLVENNYFQDVDQPWEYYTLGGQTAGKVQATGNEFDNVTGQIPGNDTVFTPPYAYTLSQATNVPMEVTTYAGAGMGPFAP